MISSAPFDNSRLYREKTVVSVTSLIRYIDQNKSSNSINSAYKYERDIYSYSIRPLTVNEVQKLKLECLCQIQDDTTVYVMFSYTSSAVITDICNLLVKYVKNCNFGGEYVIIGVDDSILGIRRPLGLPFGIYNNSLISNCIFEPGVVVHNNVVISESVLLRGASLVGCGAVSSRKEALEQNMMISLGPESGGARQVIVDPETTVVDIMQTIKNQEMDSKSNFSTSTIPWNIIKGDVQHCAEVTNVYVSDDSKLSNCSCVSSAILLPGAQIRNAIAENVYLQWNSGIVNNSNVNSVLLMESSEIGPNSVVTNTVLGPDSHLSCGEVHSSLIGPNTNAHHQSLIISALWPSGRGNVGYGSNIGSNHTCRIPDQEVTVGEGVSSF